METHVHWSEGLFLQPHHLQRMQRWLRTAVSAEHKLSWPYPFGVIEAVLARDDLTNMQLRFEKLRAVMPSGLEVNFPENAVLPVRDIRQAFAKGSGSFVVSLGVPLWFGARANTMAAGADLDSRVKLLYGIKEVQVTDENTGENPAAVQMRYINARLVLENEDTSDLEVIPLFRVIRGTANEMGLPREDPQFTGPCLVLNGSPILLNLVGNLVSNVDATRKALATQLAGPGFNPDVMQGRQVMQLLKLQVLNRGAARMVPLLAAPGVTPFEWYLELRELHGELLALHPDMETAGRNVFACAPYEHENPLKNFAELDAKLRPLIQYAPTVPFLKKDFAEVGGMITVTLTEEELKQPSQFYLAIRTKQDALGLARFVEDEDKFKFMPQTLGKMAVRGIPLKYQPQPPLGLPFSSDLHYFLLDRTANAPRWEQVMREKCAIVNWAVRQSDSGIDRAEAAFTLYMPLPSGR